MAPTLRQTTDAAPDEVIQANRRSVGEKTEFRPNVPSMRDLMEAVQREHWELVETSRGKFYAGWTLDKEAMNRQRHPGISLRDGIPVIANPANEVEIQYEHGEERDRVIGRGAGDVALVVACEWIDTGESIPAVRIFSVRRAEAHEINESTVMDEDLKQPGFVPPPDPENPPLTGKEKRMSWGDRIAQKIAAHKRRSLPSPDPDLPPE